MRLLGAVFMMFLCVATSASARNVFTVYGANGDAGATDECRNGQYLMGVVGRTGSWVDQIAVVCGEMKGDGSIVRVTQPPPTPRGGGGGGPAEGVCPRDEIVIAIRPRRTPGYQIEGVTMTCWNVKTFGKHDIEFGGSRGSHAGNPTTQACTCLPADR